MKPVNTRYVSISAQPTSSNSKSIPIRIKQCEFERLSDHRDEV